MTEEKLEPGVVARPNKKGPTRYLYRETYRDETGKRCTTWHKLPDPKAPNYAAKLARIKAGIAAPVVVQRALPEKDTFAALIKEFRKTLPNRKGRKKKGAKLAKASIDNWNTYLNQIIEEHGHKLVADIEAKHLARMQEAMADKPGRCNSYMSYMKVLLGFAARNGWIKYNPYNDCGFARMDTKEHEPWPGHVIDEVLAAIAPGNREVVTYGVDRRIALRQAIFAGLFSGQRISDIIRMRHDWVQGQLMVVDESVKTCKTGFIPMVRPWAAEIARGKAEAAKRNVLPLTLVYKRNGQPFGDTQELQEDLREIMVKLGHVRRDEDGHPLDKHNRRVTKDTLPKAAYSFHGLSKNAICAFTEAGVPVEQISAIVGKTPAIVLYYAKRSRAYMLAMDAAEKVITGDFAKLAMRGGNMGLEGVSQGV
jgi:hypothetical protein